MKSINSSSQSTNLISESTDFLSKKIRSLREGLGYSQEYVADRMNISQQMYSKIEKNPEKTTYERLKQLALVFHVNVIALLSDEGKFNLTQLSIDALGASEKMTIQSIIEVHKKSLENMTNDILALKRKIGVDPILGIEAE